MGNRPRGYTPSPPSMSRTVPLPNPPSASRARAGLGRGSRSCTPAERRRDHPMPRPGAVAPPFPRCESVLVRRERRGPAFLGGLGGKQTVPALEALEQRPLEADACVPLLRLHAVVRAAQNAVLGY